MRKRTGFALFRLLCLLVLCSLCLGALPLSAGSRPEYQQIIGIVTWSGSSSTDTDVVVTDGAMLTIDSTALVYFSNYEHGTAYPGGLNPNKIELIVESGGTLIVEAGAQLIANAAGDWYGVVFLPGSLGNITGATIRNGIVGVTIHGAGPTIQGNTIQDMRGISPGFPAGSPGEMAAGIVISGTSAAQVISNTITNITGGFGANGMDGSEGIPGGGDGGDGTAGGNGGPAYGIYIAAGAEPRVQGNTITSITGGSGASGGHGGNATAGWAVNPSGGSGGASGNGGPGGRAVGIYAEGASSSCVIQNNTLFGLTGGPGAMSGYGGAAGPGWQCGTILRPEQAGAGGDGGDGGDAGAGGSGGDAIGIMVESCSPTVGDNIISGLTGGYAEGGGDGGASGWGGSGCSGSAAQDGGAGGRGGNGGYGGTGGNGGIAIGIYVRNASTADIRHNRVTSSIVGGPGEQGGGGANGGSGGDGGNGGGDPINQSGHGGGGGDGGQGGNGGAAGMGGTAIGIHVFGGTPTVARNSVTTLTGRASAGVGGPAGSGGSGGEGGDGGTGPFSGNGGNGGVGGAGGVGGGGGYGGNALGISATANRVENNLLHSFGGGGGTAAGDGGVGGNGGNGGDAGNDSALAGSGGDGGSGGNGSNGGGSGNSYGLALSENAEVFNNTINNMGINSSPGAGSSGGSGGSGGSPGTVGQPGTPGSGGSLGNPGAAGYEGSAYGILIAAALPVVVNNIVTVTGVGQHGGAATSFGIFSSIGPLTVELDYNDVWGWSSGSYYDVTPGAHDISEDPLFVNFNNGDYHPQAGSPCRNTGYSGATAPTDDLDGNGRPQGAAHDRGAYEYVETVCIPVTGVTLSGPTWGLVGFTYGFNAAVTPTNATEPIAYTWTPAPDSGQGTANPSYTWLAEGIYYLNVAVSNCGGAGTGTDDHSITISTGTGHRVFLPVVAVQR